MGGQVVRKRRGAMMGVLSHCLNINKFKFKWIDLNKTLWLDFDKFKFKQIDLSK